MWAVCLHLSTETWDYPVIVTRAGNFLIADRTTITRRAKQVRCRHRRAHSLHFIAPEC